MIHRQPNNWQTRHCYLQKGLDGLEGDGRTLRLGLLPVEVAFAAPAVVAIRAGTQMVLDKDYRVEDTGSAGRYQSAATRHAPMR